jgi:hypothetical protein
VPEPLEAVERSDALRQEKAVRQRLLRSNSFGAKAQIKKAKTNGLSVNSFW